MGTCVRKIAIKTKIIEKRNGAENILGDKVSSILHHPWQL
jgi:hypothetical protein